MGNLTEARAKTAMKDPEHMKRWAMEAGRQWLVLNTRDLVDALPWPDGANALMSIISSYRDHRRAIPSGRIERQEQVDPMTGRKVMVDVEVFKDETLEVEELDRAIRYLVGLATDKDPSWRLTNDPL